MLPRYLGKQIPVRTMMDKKELYRINLGSLLTLQTNQYSDLSGESLLALQRVHEITHNAWYWAVTQTVIRTDGQLNRQPNDLIELLYLSFDSPSDAMLVKLSVDGLKKV
jgi:hypothetical protein